MDRQDLCRLIPHDGKMCLLDSVDSWDEDSIVCTSQTHRATDNPLRHNGHLPMVSVVEYAAQAMAVHGGLSNVDASGIGYLASIRNLQLSGQQLDKYDAPLRIAAQKIAGDDQSMMYQFQVSVNHDEVASGRAAVVLQPARELF